MTLARLAARLTVLVGLLAPLLAGAQAGAPDVTKNPKFKGWINAVPDTGQFLPDSVWLLRVGPRVTTVGDYVERWFGAYPEFRPPPSAEGRRQFLNSLMQKDILGLEALRLDRPLQFEDRTRLREARQLALAEAVYRRFVRDSVQVSDQEVRDLYDTYRYDQHLRHILLTDRNEADHVRRQLISGRLSWTAAVARYSKARAAGPQGDLGWVQRGRMDATIGNAVHALKPGEISVPLQDAAGWHIVQSVERRPNKNRPAFEGIQRRLFEDIRNRKTSVYVERILSLLRTQEEMRYDTLNVQFASREFVNTTEYDTLSLGTTININAHVPEFSPADTARLLARWKGGGRYSLGDLLHAYQHIPPLLRPSLNAPEAMIGFIETTILEPKLAEYGAQRGLESDPYVVAAIAKKREEVLVEHLYQDSVARFVWVTKDERRAYYEQNKPAFFTFASVDFGVISRPSRAGADSVANALRSGVPARAIVAADSANGWIYGSVQHRLQNESGAPYHKLLFEEMRPGDVQIVGPDRQGDFAVIQLIHFDGGRQLSYEESENMIDESLQNQKADQALQAFIERLRPRYEIASRPELLMLVKLVDPTLER